MSLPKGVSLANCVPDPSGRSNHIFHAKTDEVFHVAPDLYQSLLKMNSKVDKAGKGKALSLVAESGQTPSEETGLTLAEGDATAAEGLGEPEAEEEDAPEETENGADRAELLLMAQEMQVVVPDAASDADILELVRLAVEGMPDDVPNAEGQH